MASVEIHAPEFVATAIHAWPDGSDRPIHCIGKLIFRPHGLQNSTLILTRKKDGAEENIKIVFPSAELLALLKYAP